MKNYIIIILTLQAFCLNVGAQEKLKGRVVDAQTQEPLAGATIKVKETNSSTISNSDGYFELNLPKGDYQLQTQYLSYGAKEQSLTIPFAGNLLISLQANENTLQEVNIVSTGYQTLPKERATGSFVVIDSALLNRRVGANILDRIDGVVGGLIFNKGIVDGSNKSAITIRGRSTIFANPEPLIVLDNFPYEGDINNINPNDIANITVLKDAAASSIWGVRAGNGVIVITTKRGKISGQPNIGVNSNFTISAKPDLWYKKQLDAEEYIDLERFLFDKGHYNNTLANAYAVISPAVELMHSFKRNLITQEDYQNQIDRLKTLDVRDQMHKYFYRNAATQQYAANVNGGANNHKYFISLGVDKSLSNIVSNSTNRLTITANNTNKLFKDRLELFTSILMAKNSLSGNQTISGFNPYTPYDRLADADGNALVVASLSTLRTSYTDTVGKGKLLDWHFRPLDELAANNTVKGINYRVLGTLSYKILESLKFVGSYQYASGQTNNEILYLQRSFYTRNMINRFTSVDPVNGSLMRVIGLGDILTSNSGSSVSQYARTQLAYDEVSGSHQVNAILGLELSDDQAALAVQNYYGYNALTQSNTNATINPQASYPIYYNPAMIATIATAPGMSATVNRSVSYYANASYSYKKRYVVSGSARRDQTNIFGVKSNQKGVPLWSAGLLWRISEEPFYGLKEIPQLTMRLSYGYNGNTDKSTSAFLTSQFSTQNLAGNNYAKVINPPNPSLRWERIQNINVGLDFTSKRNFLSGSIEFFQKIGTDLLGLSPIAPQTGVITFKGNTADTKTQGLDVNLNFKVINNAKITWDISTSYNYVKEKVTGYKQTPATNSGLVNNNYANPLVGYPYYSVFAFRSPGLDDKGDPLGYLNGEVAKNYTAMYNGINRSDIVFIGAATPTSFGNLRSTISINRIMLSLNLTYKLGYYFKRTNVFSGSNYSYAQTDYHLRWQKPGDEHQTIVPALVYPNNAQRGLFFQGTEALVENGGHLRLQDIRLDYKLVKHNTNRWIKGMSAYSYVNNLGVLWRVNKLGIDPDAGTQLLPAVRSFALGLNVSL